MEAARCRPRPGNHRPAAGAADGRRAYAVVVGAQRAPATRAGPAQRRRTVARPAAYRAGLHRALAGPGRSVGHTSERQ
ncbi:hypothetical protein G6F35_018975 [Rhizopus arrhizus]|nr:hypothetical protein G6F35_018975 [Rhizopus arrhizus]